MNRGIWENKKERISSVLGQHSEWGDTRIANVTGTSMQTVKKVRKEMEDRGDIKESLYCSLKDGRKYPRSINEEKELDNKILTIYFEESVRRAKKDWPDLTEDEIRSRLLIGRTALRDIIRRERLACQN